MSLFQEDDRINVKETEYVTMFVKDGIFQCYFKSMDTMDLKVAKITVDDRLNFLNKVSYPSLFDITEVKQTTKEARDYMANEGNELVVASAMIVSNPMLKMMANFYIMVNKPKNPTKLFTDVSTALDWLKQHKTIN